MMDLSNLQAPAGANRERRRLGRGEGSGLGKTSGKGGKGQTARAGGNTKPGFEGGQMPLHRRLPKRGFTNIHAKSVTAINLSKIEATFEDGAVVDLIALHAAGLVAGRYVDETFKLGVDVVKILGQGDLTKKLTVHAHKFSQSALDKIQAAGGAAEVIGG
jgi:large subunit ribosomal protein L15